MEEGEIRPKRPKRKRPKSKRPPKSRKPGKIPDSASTKTVPCKYYIEGRCHKGLDCIFSHNVTQIQKPELCKFYLTNCCAKGSECVYSHDTKAFPCKYLHGNGHCQSGSECRFSHERLKCWELPKFIEDNYAFLKDLKDRTGSTHLTDFFDAYLSERSLLP